MPIGNDTILTDSSHAKAQTETAKISIDTIGKASYSLSTQTEEETTTPTHNDSTVEASTKNIASKDTLVDTTPTDLTKEEVQQEETKLPQKENYAETPFIPSQPKESSPVTIVQPTQTTTPDTIVAPKEKEYFVFGQNFQIPTPLLPKEEKKEAAQPQYQESLLSHNNGIKALKAYSKELNAPKAEVPIITIDGTPLKESTHSHFWVTPCLFVIFVLYAFSLASRRKTLIKDIRNLFSPTPSADSFKISPIEEFQEHLPLFVLSAANIAWLAYFCIDTFSHATTLSSVAWLTSGIAIDMTFILQLMLTQAICYVFFDNETFHKLEKLKLLSVSLCGIILIPSILMLAYSPTFFIKPAIYVGIGGIILLLMLYLLRALAFFFKGTLSIFYLILYLCTIEILPAIILIIELKRIF